MRPAKGVATDTNRIQESAMRFMLMVVEIRKLMDVEDFGDGFTPNEEIAKVKFQ